MKPQFQGVILSGQGFELSPCAGYQEALARSEGFCHIGKKFSLEGFNQKNLPVCVANFTHEELPFTGVRVLDLPIKMAGDSRYLVPIELQPYRAIIQSAIDVETQVNPSINDYLCYITVDSSQVEANTTQRRGGLHVDGFQGSRLGEPLLLDHSFLIYDCLPTQFYEGPFDVRDVDISKYNVFYEFDKRALNMIPVSFDSHQLLFVDAYTVHAGVHAPHNLKRTFIRISFSVREFDRLGNTHNPLFEYNWSMVERRVEESLQTRDDEGRG